MPLGVGSALLFAQGPRMDLEVAYLNAIWNATTITVSSATVNPGEVSPGFNLTYVSPGVATITFPKCKYCKILPFYSPVTIANGRLAWVLAGFDPTTGTATLNLTATAAGGVSEPNGANNEVELIFLLGF